MAQFGSTAPSSTKFAKYGDVEDIEEEDEFKVIPPFKTFFCIAGVLLILMTVPPIIEAVTMLNDFNYVFFFGKTVPTTVIVFSIVPIILYGCIIYSYFNYMSFQHRTTQFFMLLVTAFVTCFGLSILMVSLPLSSQVEVGYNAMMYNCEHSPMTHRLFEYSQVLHNIRRQPDCLREESVEKCRGYKESTPYTTYLKYVENTFVCAGFCFRLPEAFVSETNATQPATGMVQLSSQVDALSNALNMQRRVKKHQGSATQLTLEIDGQRGSSPLVSMYPPTLFSQAGHKTACEAQAARDLRFNIAFIGDYLFWSGLYLVFAGVMTSFLYSMQLCGKQRRGADLFDEARI